MCRDTRWRSRASSPGRVAFPAARRDLRFGESLAKNPGWHEEDAPWKASHAQSLLDEHGIRADTVCEVGTGSGEVLRLLAEGRPQAAYRGFDISPHAMRIATPKSRPGLT